MKVQVFAKSEKGTKDIGWLKSNFYFSFSDYYNPILANGFTFDCELSYRTTLKNCEKWHELLPLKLIATK
jgi:hypothetical protein